MLKTLPVRRWQSRQWHIEIFDGSPSHLKAMEPQRHCVVHDIISFYSEEAEYSRYRKNCNALMLAAERNVQHLTKNAPAAANDCNEFRWSASGHFETKSDAFSMRVYRSGRPARADVLVDTQRRRDHQ
jgi:hypothetical protein